MTIASALNRNRIPSRPVPHPAQGTASWWLFRLEWVIILRLVRLVDRRDSNEAGAGLDTVMGGFDVVPGESRRLVQISKRGWAKTSMSGRNAATSVARIGRPVGESYQAS